MKIKTAVLAIFVLAAAASGFDFVWGQGNPDQPTMAPLNPAYIRYLDTLKRGAPKRFTDDGHPLGYIPPPVRLSGPPAAANGVKTEAVYPATYDLRTTGKLTDVRDQGGSCGSCWTFGSYASLESILKPGESRNFSEQDLNANHGFTWAECEGGNSWISAAYLARWSGPFNEPEVPYPYSSAATPTTPVKHIQRIQWAPERGTAYTSNDDIKYLVTNYGATAFSYRHDNAYYNATNKAYYYTGVGASNHMVAVVGWNDNYPAANFNSAPPGNGAFIVKNSWGTGWGDSGYFYMSYYDTSFGEVTSFNGAESTANYRGIYQYDPLGWVSGLGYTTNWHEIWGANIFTAASTEEIGAIGTYATDPNTQITAYVYTDVTAGNPTSGTLAATKVYTAPYSGYYTIKLDTPVAMTQGQRFSVVIQYYNTNNPSTQKWLLPFEYRDASYSAGATSNTGESFYKQFSGNTWSDFYTWSGGTYYPNCCIKAYVGGDCTPNAKDDFVGTWGDGVYYRNSDSGAWVNMGSSASLITVGDLDGDCIDDLIGIWPTQGGVWVKYSKTGSWAMLSSTAAHITTGDMNGDGKPELLGTWDGQGVYWRDNTTGAWTQLASPASLITAGDIDGDGKDDLVGIWPGQGGVWVKYSAGGTWSQLSSTAADIASGDLNGDGRDELLATYDGQGVYYRNSLTGGWTQMATPATQTTQGDLDGDLTADLIGIWPSQSGVWVKYSATGTWALLSSTATDIVSGKMRAAGSAGVFEPMRLAAPAGGYLLEPRRGGPGTADYSAVGPGGKDFVPQIEPNLIPVEQGGMTVEKQPGPGEPGFRCVIEKNLVPREQDKSKDRGRK
jgi:C1A family cysteine protease